MRQMELHNQLAGDIVKRITIPVLENGGTPEDALILLESVVTGVFLTVVKPGGDESVADALMVRVKARLSRIRLDDLPPSDPA